MGRNFKNKSEKGSAVAYVNTSQLQSLMSRTESHVVIVNFVSESDLPIYGLGQKIIRWSMKGVGTLIKTGIHTLEKNEQENTLQKNKTR